MKIIFINRNPIAGYSIYKVFKPIINLIENKEEMFLPRHGGSFLVLLSNCYYIFKNRKNNAIHHITGDIHYGILALIGCRSILTIHDTVSLNFNNACKLKKKLIEWIWYRIPLKYATKVTCISEQTKQSLLKLTNRTDICVIHNPIDNNLNPSPLKPISDQAKILFIGVKDNKNLLRCFEALKDINCHVTVVGKLNSKHIKALIDNDIKFTSKSNLSDEELNEEYYNCDIVSFCSLYEGFGMPVLEGQQAGRPVLCSSLPVLKEISGDAACFVDPYNVEAIHNGYLKLINDEQYRKQLVKKGRLNVLKYLPTEIKKQWDKVYNELSELSHPL